MPSPRALRGQLARSITASGYEIAPNDNRLDRLVAKLECLQEAGRYARLLVDLFAANEEANLRSHVLEATLAFQFESAGMPLQYEVRRREDETSVDFLRQTDWGKDICVEVRLVQQRQVLTALFEEQLRDSNFFGATLDGVGDQAETLRLQRLVFAKAVNPSGQLIKFSPEDKCTYNIIAIEVSELHLGMIDHLDCRLVAYGDPAVPELALRQLFGLFQEPQPEYPDHIQEVATRYAPFREAIHAILFLRKVPPTHPIDYCLEYILTHNPKLVPDAELELIGQEFLGAMNVWESVRRES